MREKKQTIRDEDFEFVSLCKKGEVDAFEVLVRKHQKRMLNIAYRMIGDYDEACEIVKGRSKFSTWLYTIVMNLAKNRLKQLKTQRNHEKYSIDDPLLTNEGEIHVDPASGDPSPLERLEKKDIQHKVQGCIDSLEHEFREVIVLRDIQGFSYDEISNVLELPEGTVKSRLFRARDAVKDCLKRVIGDLRHGMP
jgi:RNA polymerase sigma-70 factor (ECF subfamily)